MLSCKLPLRLSSWLTHLSTIIHEMTQSHAWLSYTCPPCSLTPVCCPPFAPQNLEKTIDNKSLHDTFTAFGTILSCKVASDPKGESKGYGFVHFETDEAAAMAIEKMTGMEVEGKVISVSPFIKRDERGSGEKEAS